MSDDLIDRKFSNGTDWDNSIDVDDASDGSEGGYDRYGGYINAHGMMEIIKLRVENAALRALLRKARNYVYNIDKRDQIDAALNKGGGGHE